MTAKTMLWLGGGGSAVTAICCFTPVLVIVLGGFGLSAWLAWADFVLLPLLAAFLTLTVAAMLRLRRQRQSAAADAS